MSDTASADTIPDDAIVCRGGLCLALSFRSGSGVSTGADGRLSAVSVNCAPGVPLADLAATIPNRQIGMTTVQAVRAQGGEVVATPNSRNPYHCDMNGLTAEQAEALFRPTIPNPNAG